MTPLSSCRKAAKVFIKNTVLHTRAYSLSLKCGRISSVEEMQAYRSVLSSLLSSKPAGPHLIFLYYTLKPSN